MACAANYIQVGAGRGTIGISKQQRWCKSGAPPAARMGAVKGRRGISGRRTCPVVRAGLTLDKIEVGGDGLDSSGSVG